MTSNTTSTMIRALDPIESAEVFRAILAAASEPGLVVHLRAGAVPPIALAPLVLTDLETTIHVELDSDDMRRAILAVTGAVVAGPDAAMVVSDRPREELIGALRVGSPLAPEDGCRLVLACTGIESMDDGAALSSRQGGGPSAIVRLTGPGVASSTTIRVTGVDASVFRALAERNSAFPAGIDTVLVTHSGDAAVIPRSVGLVVEED